MGSCWNIYTHLLLEMEFIFIEVVTFFFGIIIHRLKKLVASEGLWIEKPATFDYFSEGILNYTLNLFHPSYWPSWGILFFFVFISILYLIKSVDRKKYSIIFIWFFSILIGTEILNSITSLNNWQAYILVLPHQHQLSSHYSSINFQQCR